MVTPSKGHTHRLTEDEEARFFRMATDGATDEDLSAAFGVKVHSVYAIRKRLHCTRKHLVGEIRPRGNRKAAANQRAIRRRRKANNQCQRCGKPLTPTGCPPCQEYDRERMRKRRQDAVDLGVCFWNGCFAEAVEGTIYCKAHQAWYAEYHRRTYKPQGPCGRKE